ISTEYHDWRGRRIEVGEATLVAVLAAFGVDASSTENCRSALHTRRARRTLPAAVVLRAEAGSANGRGTEVTALGPAGPAPRLWIELEDGSRRYDLANLRSRPG